MDLRKLKTLVDLVSESNISELEITEAEGKVRIVKASAPVATAMQAMVPVAAARAADAVAAAQPPAAAAPPAAAEVPAAPNGHVIKSPMVGTYYRASSPGAAPLVDVGTAVKEGDAVCIIEAMKIMNEIESTASGTITQVLCENGQAVEFGQPLFVVE